ncbi:hypothetical protein GW927_01130 [Candidatus Pacearchaeota archaeon]|nr:hypothetical protein [Candidatus Pacearchaeota archaeon]
MILAVMSSIFLSGFQPFHDISGWAVFLGGLIASFILGLNNGMNLVLLHLGKVIILLLLYASITSRMPINQLYHLF